MAERIAVVTMGVKLPGETRGYTRFRFLAEFLAQRGYEVELITSSFQHWDKAQRDTSSPQYRGLPYRLTFIWEPGYSRNLDLRRIASHAVAARGVRDFFAAHVGEYDLIYSEIPPNDVALACARAAETAGVPYVADINDLWPEAMRMVLDVPVLSDVAFSGFARDAHAVYNLLAGAVGTSDEYAARPAADRVLPYPHVTCYVGNDLSEFDAGVQAHAAEVEKPPDEFWVMYTGTLGASYDLETAVRAAALLAPGLPGFRLKILGDGPDRARLEELAARQHAPVDFLGYTPYPLMAAHLARCDVTLNSLVAAAPQSIVTKIGDYLAAGKPMVNTGSSPEFRAKVAADGFGVNIAAEDPVELAGAVEALAADPDACAAMGTRARQVAEEQFDRPRSYGAIADLIAQLIAQNRPQGRQAADCGAR